MTNKKKYGVFSNSGVLLSTHEEEEQAHAAMDLLCQQNPYFTYGVWVMECIATKTRKL